jgi:hypothetical protein
VYRAKLLHKVRSCLPCCKRYVIYCKSNQGQLKLCLPAAHRMAAATALPEAAEGARSQKHPFGAYESLGGKRSQSAARLLPGRCQAAGGARGGGAAAATGRGRGGRPPAAAAQRAAAGGPRQPLAQAHALEHQRLHRVRALPSGAPARACARAALGFMLQRPQQPCGAGGPDAHSAVHARPGVRSSADQGRHARRLPAGPEAGA